MSNLKKFHGTGVAIVTPFKNHEVDFDGLINVVNHVIDGGVEYLVVLGSTGEAATVNPREERAILDKVIEVNAGRKPIVAGNFSGNNTIENCRIIEKFDFTGIDALLVSSPAYIKPSQIGIYTHYMELAKASPIPIIIYNVPGRTRSNMEWQTTVKLANDSDKFIGIKEASGDLIQATRIIKNKPPHFFVTSGDDEIAMAMVACGGDGVISVMANVFPRHFSEMIRYALDSDFRTAHKVNLDLYDLHKWLYIEGNPVGIKAAMEIIEKCTKEVRLPLYPLSNENFASLKKEIKKIQNL
ncbi:MAG: 4-hydroxy-tetrahydrodipicolinate synthase [Bacteroidota bacterium]